MVLTTPVLIAVVIAAGLGFCRVTNVQLHAHELVVAAVVFLLAAQVAILPLVMQRQPDMLQLTRSALLGLVIHLFTGALLGILAILVTGPSVALAVWILIFYWTTLTGLATVFIRAVRSASVAGNVK